MYRLRRKSDAPRKPIASAEDVGESKRVALLPGLSRSAVGLLLAGSGIGVVLPWRCCDDVVRLCQSVVPLSLPCRVYPQRRSL